MISAPRKVEAQGGERGPKAPQPLLWLCAGHPGWVRGWCPQEGSEGQGRPLTAGGSNSLLLTKSHGPLLAIYPGNLGGRMEKLKVWRSSPTSTHRLFVFAGVSVGAEQACALGSEGCGVCPLPPRSSLTLLQGTSKRDGPAAASCSHPVPHPPISKATTHTTQTSKPCAK